MISSDHIPKEIKIRNSNNNLDVVKFNERYYFAFRTAPTQFPSGRAAIYIMKFSDDGDVSGLTPPFKEVTTETILPCTPKDSAAGALH